MKCATADKLVEYFGLPSTTDDVSAVVIERFDRLIAAHKEREDLFHELMQRHGIRRRLDEPAVAEPARSALMEYMTAETSAARDAAFLRTYAARVRDRTAASWEIPNTIASTLEDIAKRLLGRESQAS